MDINELLFLGTNKYGQAGIGEKYHNKTFNTPKSFSFPIFIKQISCGAHHSALLTIDGSVYTMGSNIHGALGSNSSLNYSFLPTLVDGLTEVTKIQCGPFHMCAISNNSLYSWGKGIDGQLGHGNTKNMSKPTKIQAITDPVETVSCGTNHTLVLVRKENQSVCLAFGNGIYGQLGTGQSRNSYIPIKTKLQQVSAIAAGDNHSLFVVKGSVFACGDNSNGQLGSLFAKKFNPEPTNVDFQGKDKIVTVQAKKYSLALTDAGEMYVWGLRGGFGAAKKLKGTPSSNMEMIDARISNDKCYALNTEGALYSWDVQKGQESGKFWSCENQIVISNNRAVLDFSVGQGYLLILGDIVNQVQYSSVPPSTLSCIQDAQNSVNYSQREQQSNFRNCQLDYMQTSNDLSNSGGSVQEKIKPQSHTPNRIDKSHTRSIEQQFAKPKLPHERVDFIESQCLQERKNFNNLVQPKRLHQKLQNAKGLTHTHTPIGPKHTESSINQDDTYEMVKSPSSSIQCQPTNFLRQSLHKQQQIQARHKVVTCSILEPEQQVPIPQSIPKSIRNQNFGENKENMAPKKTQKRQKHKKIDRLMQLLQKSHSISERSLIDSHLKADSSQSSLNQSDILKTNRLLRIELRQKQLKVSQLQEILSRKEMQIEAQRQLIKMLRDKNASNFASLQRA